MKVGFPGGPRLEWYDRNPQSQSFIYTGQDVAPHLLTVRFSYTVPTGKKAMCEVARAAIVRVTVAGTPDRAQSQIGVRGNTILRAKILTNDVGDKDSEFIGEAGVLASGEEAIGRTIDESTDGTVDYDLALQLTEFDA